MVAQAKVGTMKMPKCEFPQSYRQDTQLHNWNAKKVKQNL